LSGLRIRQPHSLSQPYSKAFDMKISSIKVGDLFPMNSGGSVIVVRYQNAFNVVVEWLDENKHRAKVRTLDLRKGKGKNPFSASVYGHGFVGVGNYRTTTGGELTLAYKVWTSMLKRCYSPLYLKKYPTYRGCSVHSDWLSFQSFAAWHEKEDNSQKIGFDLDKDLRVHENKVYGPETCSFVPQQINKLLTNCGVLRGDLPRGVCAAKKYFTASLRVRGKRQKLGSYATPELAYEVYKKAKEANVKSMAEEWRDYLHPEVYDYLRVWTLV